MSKSDDQTVKLVAETIKAGLTKFVGEKVDSRSLVAITSHMHEVLTSFGVIADLPGPLPKIDVTLEGTEATISFRDPKTDEEIDLAMWMSRSSEGFYE